jgi:inner membrane protein
VLVVGATHRVAKRRRVFVAIGGWALVCGSFGMGSSVARGAIDDHLAAAYPGAALHDVALTPMPSHPFCWTAVSVLTTPERDLVIHHATVAPVPSLVDVSACPAGARGATATLGPAPGSSDDRIRARGEFRARADELRALARRCDIAAAMRFMRAPYWKLEPGRLIVGDGRYDNDEAIDFADVDLPVDEPGACPPFVPPWVPPREDVLTGGD